MPHKQIQIQTITPRYDIIEDRIRFSFNQKNTEEQIDFMLTRKFILKLLLSYEEYLLKVYAQELKKKDKNRQVKHKVSPIYNHHNLETYQYHAELLLSLEFSFIQSTQFTKILFKTRNTQAIITLDYHKLTNLFSLIKSTIPYFEWSISPHI